MSYDYTKIWSRPTLAYWLNAILSSDASSVLATRLSSLSWFPVSTADVFDGPRDLEENDQNVTIILEWEDILLDILWLKLCFDVLW